MKNKIIRVFDMFTGYGGAEFALKKAGINHETVGYSEIDSHAIKCFETNFKSVRALPRRVSASPASAAAAVPAARPRSWIS